MVFVEPGPGPGPVAQCLGKAVEELSLQTNRITPNYYYYYNYYYNYYYYYFFQTQQRRVSAKRRV